ncbi:MAG: endolytic transglycosylase MltG [Pseudomonadota bacterium]
MKRGLLILIALTALAAACAAGGWYWLNDYARTPMQHQSDYALTVEPGQTLGAILEVLAADNVIAHPRAVRWHARLADRGNQIQAGRYTLTPGLTPSGLLDQLRDGAVDLVRVQFIEGWTAAQAVEAVIQHSDIANDLDIAIEHRADGVAFLSETASDALISALDLEVDNIEGWLYPDTYQFAPGTKASELLRLAHQKMQRELDAAWLGRRVRDTLPDKRAMLTLASIVEKETSRDDERAEIAGVFDRRLVRSMRLQTDPTVIYGVGIRYDGDIRRRDLTDDNRYNTYRIDGLPPTPIALAGRASLDAVANPSDGSALFFVASGDSDGRHVFTDSVEAHERAVQQYLKKIRNQ